MPTKPPFDPRIHLLNDDGKPKQRAASADDELKPSNAQLLTDSSDDGKPRQTWRRQSRGDFGVVPSAARMPTRRSSSDVDDEMLARLLHQQMVEEDRKVTFNSLEDDEEYARRMQYEEEIAGQRPNTSGNFSGASLSTQGRDAGIADRLEYARRVQAQALFDIQRKSPVSTTKPQQHAKDDMELAIHLQEMETLNINAEEPCAMQESGDSFDYQRAIAEAESLFDTGGRVAGIQEEADARLARMMTETGQSLRNLNDGKTLAPGTPKSFLTEQEEIDARLARMMEETGDSLRDLTDLPTDAQASPPSEGSQTTELGPPDRPETKLPPQNELRMPNPRIAEPAYRSAPRSVPLAGSIGGGPAGASASNSSHDEMNNMMPTIPAPKEKTKKRLGLLKFSKKNAGRANSPPHSIPAPIPPRPPHGRPGPLPYSESASHNMGGLVEKGAQLKKKGIPLPSRSQGICCVCKQPASTHVVALNKKFHLECFRCAGCNQTIDPSSKFAFMSDDSGGRYPLHGSCYEELYGVKCAVCCMKIPAGPDGKVSYVKHPFFDTEQMCPRHAVNPGRRCTGCHRFEPEDSPFADLNDAGRCVCFSCCRTVVVDSADAKPLWDRVVAFFEGKLGLPVWPDMKKVPVLVVGHDALNMQLQEAGGTHGGSTQIMTRGLCLSEHQSGRKLQISRLRFDQRSGSFQSRDMEEQGFTYFRVPDPNKVNPDASVTCILCLSGLPSDLTASVLAHEATHAWIKLHPSFEISRQIPPQVEEGVAQLIAMLFLTEGLDSASSETHGEAGPTEAKLRQYFKFSIETDDNEIYGEGYRKAARAYADIGIEALLSHIILYQDFPQT